MLSVADIHVEYGRTPALMGPSLTVDAGEIVSIIGRNGVGKTTLLKAIIGLLRVACPRTSVPGGASGTCPRDA
jgi:ABC-type branched-subunit amino acid transport system ATPase component